MDPRAALARMQFLRDLDLALRELEALFVVALMHCVFAKKLRACRLRKENVVFDAEVDRVSGPGVGVVKKAGMLVSTGGVSVDLGHHRRGKRADTLALRRRLHYLSGTQQQLAREGVTSREMMKTSFGR